MPSKIVTPMARLRPQFDAFNQLVVRLTGIPVELNKAGQQSRPYLWERNGYSLTKGVESDFVRYYPLSADASFGFVFTFLEGADQLVQFTVKEGKRLTGSEMMPVETARQKLKDVTRQLQEQKPLYRNDLMTLLHNTFMHEQVMDTDAEVKQAIERIQITCADEQEALASAVTEFQALSSQLDEAEVAFKEQVDALPETQRLEALRREMHEVELALAARKTGIKQDLGINPIKRKMDKSLEEVIRHEKARQAIFTETLAQHPVFLASRISRVVEEAPWWQSTCLVRRGRKR